MSLTGSNFYFEVDSSYKIEKHQIDLVPSDQKMMQLLYLHAIIMEFTMFNVLEY